MNKDDLEFEAGHLLFWPLVSDGDLSAPFLVKQGSPQSQGLAVLVSRGLALVETTAYRRVLARLTPAGVEAARKALEAGG